LVASVVSQTALPKFLLTAVFGDGTAGPSFCVAGFILEIIDEFLYASSRFAEPGDEAEWDTGGRKGWSGSDR